MSINNSLNKLEPINLGTWMSESLTSYITRLAYSHSISSYRLIDQIISPAASKKTSMSPNSLYLANGPSSYAETCTEIISLLTGNNNIKCTTMLALNVGTISASRGLLRKKRAWCPECYKELHNNSTVYEPLLWALQPVTFCPIHQIALAEHCPECNKKQPFILGHPQLEHCYSCSSLLFNKDNISHNHSDATITEANEWKTYNMADLVELCSSTPHNPIDVQIRRMIDRYKYSVFNGSYCKMAGMLSCSLNLSRHWIYGGTKAKIGSLLDFCYKLEKPLIDFIQNFGPVTFPTRWGSRLTNSWNVRWRKQEDHDIAENYLKSLISDPPDPFPSLPSICKALGCTPGYVNYRFPELRDTLRDLYMASQKRHSADRLAKKIAQITNAIKYLHKNGIYPSYNALSKKTPRGWYKNTELANHRRKLIKKLYDK